MLDVRGRHDRRHAGRAPCGAGVEPHDPRVAVGTAHEMHVEHAEHGDVVEVAAAARHERAVFHALERGADVAVGGRGHVSERADRVEANCFAAWRNATTTGWGARSVDAS